MGTNMEHEPMGESGHEPALPDAPERPPRGVRTMAIVRWIILAMSIVAAVGSWWTYAYADKGAASSSAKYQCPMHPQIVSDVPGECPICHMTLEPISADRLGAAAPSAKHDHALSKPSAPPTHVHDTATSIDKAAPKYTCPMDPEVVSDKPGRCPKCGMDLVRNEKKTEGKLAPDAHDQPGQVPGGTTPVSLSLDRVQAIGVRTAVVQEKPTTSDLRVTATVAAPEQNVAEVHTRTSGFVESISAPETGIRVGKGQTLVSIYSPEVYQAQSELLATKDWPSLNIGGSAEPSAVGGRGEAVRRKLELLGVSDKVADQVIFSGKPSRTIGIAAPIGGYITKKNVVLGSYVTPEMVLYEIANLSKVYIIAEVFQQHMNAIQPGTRGRFASTRKNIQIDAKVDLIYPQVNLEARTTRVRMQVANDKLVLLPGDYGYVEFSSESKTALVVPRDAIVDTGKHTYVFAEEHPGHYVPKSVVLGADLGDSIEIREGLGKGERVVSGATFLIDSESRLQASLASSSDRAAPTHQH